MFHRATVQYRQSQCYKKSVVLYEALYMYRLYINFAVVILYVNTAHLLVEQYIFVTVSNYTRFLILHS